MSLIYRSAFAMLLALSCPAFADGSWRAIDGDTIVAPDGRHIRIMGVDSPELAPHAQCDAEARAAAAAKSYTSGALISARKVELLEHGLDKYRRTLAVVLIDGRDLAELIIKAKHGRPYHGEKRQGWC